MTVSPDAIKKIIDTEVAALRAKLPADGGVAVSLYYPANPEVQAIYVYGQANATTAVAPDTIFAIGSVTKTFTATLAAWLCYTNQLTSLEVTVANYLPGTSDQNPSLQPITFFNLATQTSGFPRDDSATGADPARNLFKGKPPSQPLLSWWENNQFAPPNGTWLYSNLGFITLGFAVEGAGGGRNYPTLLSQAITGSAALNMPDTFGVIPSNIPASQISTGHVKVGGQWEPRPIANEPDLKSSPQDMLTWMTQNLLAQQAGSPTPVQQAMTMATTVRLEDVYPPNSKTALPFSMGLAWQIRKPDSSFAYPIIAKDGATSRGGSSCWLGMLGPTGPGALGLAILTNCDGVGPDAYGYNMLKQIAALS
jgi:CubicO group peptidase (beta-lactamase class C family)